MHKEVCLQMVPEHYRVLKKIEREKKEGDMKKDPMVIHYRRERSDAYLLSNGPSVGSEGKKPGGRGGGATPATDRKQMGRGGADSILILISPEIGSLLI